MSGKRRRAGPYFTDKKIVPRVRDYVKQSGKKYPQPEDIVDYLKANFSEYGRTSNSALKGTVEKGGWIVCGSDLQKLEKLLLLIYY